MPTVLFTNLALLGGFAALAIPILIHLLLKRKKQRLRFSTVQFFVKQDEQASKRRKLRNWLLLAVRLLLITLLVLAFARPFKKAPAANGEPRRRLAVFVLDRSASMGAIARGETQWKRALDLTRKALREFKAGDEAAVVTCAARTETLSPLKPAAALARVLDGLEPEFGSGNLADGLRAALKFIPTDDPTVAKTIYVVTDLQKTAGQDLQSVPLPPDTEVKVLNSGDLFAPNIAASDLRVEGQVRPLAQISLRSYSDEDAGALKVSLSIDGKESGNASVSLMAGGETNLALALPPLKPGWHSAEARVQSEDALHADNVRYLAFSTPEPVRVLCVETKPGAHVHERDSFFVASALQPGTDGGAEVPALFVVELTDLPGLAAKVQPGGKSPSYGAVLLPSLRQIPGDAGEILAAYVRGGGGLLFFLGDGVSANRYNAEFRDLLPVQLGAAEVRANAGWRLGTFEKSSPVFASFEGLSVAGLRLPEFTRRFGVSMNAEASMLASFDDGIPLLALRHVGAGQVMFANTSADASWSDWPKRKSFVPWLHGAVNFLSSRSSKEAMQPSLLLAAGDEAELAPGPQWKGHRLTIKWPGGKDELVSVDDDGRLQHVNLAAPGVYSLRDPAGLELRRWAVNVPLRESDLAAFSAQDFQKQLVRVKEPRPVSLQANLLGATEGRTEWWRALLLAALALLLLEVFLANRTAA